MVRGGAKCVVEIFPTSAHQSWAVGLFLGLTADIIAAGPVQIRLRALLREPGSVGAISR